MKVKRLKKPALRNFFLPVLIFPLKWFVNLSVIFRPNSHRTRDAMRTQIQMQTFDVACVQREHSH